LTRCTFCAPNDRKQPWRAERKKKPWPHGSCCWIQPKPSSCSAGWHFEDKAALYNALLDRLSHNFEGRVQDIQTLYPQDPVAALRSLANVPVQLVLGNDQVRRLVTIAMHRVEFSEDLAAIWVRHVSKGHEYMALAEDLLRAVEASGHPLRLPIPAAALGLFTLVDGLLTYVTLDPGRLCRLQEASQLIDAFLAGVGCPLPA